MAEEPKWKKWEYQSKPEGKGGMSVPVGPDEVEGRGWRVRMIQCLDCGAPGLILRESDWYTCWKCGTTSSQDP